jgi:DNA-binding LacI/PurR family transcriptional regulator
MAMTSSTRRSERAVQPRPTLESVAAAAGVSRGTASRALNGGTNVSPKALQAVLDAAAALGYRPNLAARSLVLGRSGSIGLLVSESDDRLFNDPFFAKVVRGAHRELADNGMQLVLSLSQTPEERAQTVRFAAGRHLDGVLLISVRGGDPLPEALLEAGIPVIMAGRESRARTERGLWWVDADNRGGAREAVRYLVGTGRRVITCVAGPADLAVGRDRAAGWRDELRATQGQRPAAERLERGEFTIDYGYEATRRLLRRVPDLDAVFACGDLLAVGALQALREAGRRVPDDVALVGFDDIPAAEQTDPPLTTVRQPVEAIGRRMAAMMISRLGGQDVEPWAVLPTELVVRQSA